jgi:hypothetical protein
MLRRTRLPLLTLLIGLALAPQASAQATRTWVSGVGDDANPCSRTAPCFTLAGAISKTAEYGEINAIDAMALGSVTITKSITIDVANVKGGVLNSLGQNGVTVAAQPDDVVTLRGLDIHGVSSGVTGCNTASGIRILGAKTVRIEDTRISQQQRAIWVTPTAPVDVLVNRVDIANNCAGGVALEPGAGGSAEATVVNSAITNSGTALRAAGGAAAWLGNTTVFGNALGLEAAGGGTITDWGDNRFAGNADDGAATTRLGQAVPGPAGPQGTSGPAGTPGPEGAAGPLALQVLLAQERMTARTGRKLRVRFVTTAAASARLTVVRAGKTVATMAKRVPAGASSITWNGRAGARRAKKGGYRLIVAVSGSGQRASAEAPLKLR